MTLPANKQLPASKELQQAGYNFKELHISTITETIKWVLDAGYHEQRVKKKKGPIHA
jgi:hypothetical protein